MPAVNRGWYRFTNLCNDFTDYFLVFYLRRLHRLYFSCHFYTSYFEYNSYLKIGQHEKVGMSDAGLESAQRFLQSIKKPPRKAAVRTFKVRNPPPRGLEPRTKWLTATCSAN